MYLLFAGKFYYPSGGVCDYRGSYNAMDEAKAAFEAYRAEEWYAKLWAHIAELDGTELRIVLEFEDDRHEPGMWEQPERSCDGER